MRLTPLLAAGLLSLAALLPARALAGPSGVAMHAMSEDSDTLTLRYFGAAGWELSGGAPGSADRVVVLVDPYLTRANYSGSPGPDPDDTRPVYTRSDLHAGFRFTGPAIVEQVDSTVVVPPGMTAEVDRYLNIIIRVSE